MTFKALDTRLESTVVLVFNSRKIYMLLWASLPLFLIPYPYSSFLSLITITDFSGKQFGRGENSKH